MFFTKPKLMVLKEVAIGTVSAKKIAQAKKKMSYKNCPNFFPK